jgi:hypothetical protein
MRFAMADMALSREAKVVLSIPASPELPSAWMVNSDGATSMMVPRGRWSLSLNIQVPGLNSAGVTTTSTAASPQGRIFLRREIDCQAMLAGYHGAEMGQEKAPLGSL